MGPDRCQRYLYRQSQGCRRGLGDKGQRPWRQGQALRQESAVFVIEASTVESPEDDLDFTIFFHFLIYLCTHTLGIRRLTRWRCARYGSACVQAVTALGQITS